MCEWLTREEWCDVRLLCGGQAFGAHRAVLASVSGFLRRILLSCPTEDMPTLIVLPDFDLEALTAVLYYIYNGEVTIPRQKVDKFLDIVKAMQIFIDRQYLTQSSINIDIDYNANKSIRNNFSVFVLRSEKDDTKSSLVTFRKLCMQPKDDTDYKEAPRNWNEQFMPVSGNLQSAHKDRQRDYFLRDSFMETYPRNRNANGRAAGVPAIPNRCYRSATSLFLTNAKINEQLSPDTENLLSDNDIVSKMAYNLSLTSKSHQEGLAETRKNRSSLSSVWTESSLKMKTLGYNVNYTSYLDLSTLQKAYTAMPTLPANHKLPWFSKSDNCKRNTDERSVSCNSQHKAAILNKALDSPWSPRLPNCFRPFRRKGPSLSSYLSNDSNNNVQVTPALNQDERVESPGDLCNSSHYVPRTVSSPEESKFISYTTNNQQSPSRGRYTCSECSKSFSQLRNYKYHMSVHRGTREFAASCSVCGKSFNDRGYLSSHMKIHRNRKEYKCSQCPKSFNQRVAYNMHVRIHTGVKPHVCPTCGKAFSRKMLLKQHQRTHSGERPYACPHCDKRFADRSNMTLHLRLHTGVKPFKCPMCPKSFTKKHHLKSHVNFHTGAKPYSCPRCNLAFTQSSNMRTHLKRCNAPEPTTASENHT